MSAVEEDLYLVFSIEHGAWWKAGRRGYVDDIRSAGHYSRREALIICAQAIPGTAARIRMLPEVPVRLSDLMMMRTLTDEKWRDPVLI